MRAFTDMGTNSKLVPLYHMLPEFFSFDQKLKHSKRPEPVGYRKAAWVSTSCFELLCVML
jgi:hypothetical protein